MKKSLLSVGGIFFLILNLSGQGIPAPTTIQKKKVLLELYSGINCQYCPTGDRLAEQLLENNPGKVFILDIQTGIYAEPGTGQPDYRTPFGPALENLIGLDGYPAGTVNRHVFAGWGQTATSMAMPPAYFDDAAYQEMTLDAAANIGVEAELDVQSKLLTVNVEVYYTGSPSSTTNRLNVALIQDNIIGPQVIGSTVTPDPDLVLPNGDYIHNNMLRHLLTGQFGVSISPAVPGSRIQKTFTYQIPANDSIYEVPAVIGDLEVIVFLAENTKEIINVELVKPTLTNFLYSLDPGITEAGGSSEAECGEFINTPFVRFANYGGQTITTLQIDYTINGSIHQRQNWSGSVAPYSEEEITLNPIRYYPLEINTLTVSISQPNGNPDQNSSNDVFSAEFNSAPDASNLVTMRLQLDYWGSEVTWELVNSSNTVLYSGGPYTDVPNPSNNPPLPAPIIQSFSLPSGDCYFFKTYDEYKDGILGTNTGFTLTDDNGLVIVSNFADYDSAGYVSFGVDAPKVDSSDVFTGIIETASSGRIEIYPNPASGTVHIRLPAQTEYPVVYFTNVLGEIAQSLARNISTENSSIQIDTGTLPSGIYILNIIAGDRRYAEKIAIGF